MCRFGVVFIRTSDLKLQALTSDTVILQKIRYGVMKSQPALILIIP